MFVNNNLPRYYFGDNGAQQKDYVNNQGNTSNYFSQMDKDQEINQPTSETSICQSKDANIQLTSVIEELYMSEPNLSRIPSPASSVASNKKLEWDSGADIGYNVEHSLKHSRKCKSFPILHVDLSPISHIIQLNDQQISTKITAKLTDNVKKLSDQSVEERPLKLNKKKESFQHSTPIEQKISTKLSMRICDDDNSMSSERKSKNKDKIATKRSNKDECLQTSLINICSKSVQTDDEHLMSENIIKVDKTKVNRSQQTDAVRPSPEHTSTVGSSSQTSSFQYIPGSNIASRTPSENISDSSKTSNKSNYKTNTPPIKESVQLIDSTSNTILKLPLSSKSQTNSSHSSKTHSHSSESSNNSPLGKMISTQQSKNLIADIDKSLYLLQRFLKSRNYNADTKKHYAKKIVNKILQNKYTDDSSVTNKSDECSCCCTSNSSTERRKYDSGANTNKTGKSTNESENVPENNENKNQLLKESKETNGEMVQDYIKQLQSLNPDFVDCAIQCDPHQSYFMKQNNSSNKKSPLDHGTSISTELGITLSFKDDKIREIKRKSRENVTDKVSSPDYYSDTSSKNWKEEKTLSEKLFEAKQKYSSSELTIRNNSLNNNAKLRLSDALCQSKSDYLIEHSKKEKKRQLSWINNEIVYLRELKNLLQRKDVTSDTSNNATEISETSIKDARTKRVQHQTSETDNSHSHNSSLNINNLSKYLTNDQIKFLIKHDASKIHNHSCACCKSKSLKQDSTSKPSDIDHSQTTGNKSSFQDTVLSEINGFSYSSHNYNIRKTAKSTTKENLQVHSRKIVDTSVPKPPEMLDAGIQCTIRKKKKSETNATQSSEISSSVCTELSKENLSTGTQSICISVENVYHSTNSDETTKISASDSSSQISTSMRSQKSGKENRSRDTKGRRSNSAKENTHPLAYFLTFEEKTPSDMSINQDTANKKHLPNVVVKVPKLRKVVKEHKDISKTVPDYTLQEYLCKNRPDFIQIAEWRRHHVADPRGKQPTTLFTCRELKEITLKQYKKLPEVQNKIKDNKIQNQRRQNRCMASMFSKKLQKKTLQGQISLSTCINVMSSSS